MIQRIGIESARNARIILMTVTDVWGFIASRGLLAVLPQKYMVSLVLLLKKTQHGFPFLEKSIRGLLNFLLKFWKACP